MKSSCRQNMHGSTDRGHLKASCTFIFPRLVSRGRLMKLQWRVRRNYYHNAYTPGSDPFWSCTAEPATSVWAPTWGIVPYTEVHNKPKFEASTTFMRGKCKDQKSCQYSIVAGAEHYMHVYRYNIVTGAVQINQSYFIKSYHNYIPYNSSLFFIQTTIYCNDFDNISLIAESTSEIIELHSNVSSYESQYCSSIHIIIWASGNDPDSTTKSS